jgi:hypothetical protein
MQTSSALALKAKYLFTFLYFEAYFVSDHGATGDEKSRSRHGICTYMS